MQVLFSHVVSIYGNELLSRPTPPPAPTPPLAPTPAPRSRPPPAPPSHPVRVVVSNAFGSEQTHALCGATVSKCSLAICLFAAVCW